MTYATTDTALERIATFGPEVWWGGPNHAPMVIEALAKLGRDGDVLGWLGGYRERLVPIPQTQATIGSDWSQARGIFERYGDWTAFFRGLLAESSWPEVVRDWCPRLMPGIMAAGTHGLIRTAHAVRSLADASTPQRLEELARALAYWAARYQELPGAPNLCGSSSMTEAVRALPLLDPSLDRSGPPPRVVRRLLADLGAFSTAVNALAPPKTNEDALSELSAAGAQLYLANAEHHPLVFLHTITATADLRLLLDNLGPQHRQTAFAYMWQAVAAWAVTFRRRTEPQEVRAPELSADVLVALAVESGDEHAIKLTDAVLREEQRNSTCLYRSAAEDWIERVACTREWSIERRTAAGMVI